MRCLSLTQPYATLVSISAKTIETRSWKTNYRGPLAIHAAKGFPKWAKDICQGQPFRTCLGLPEPYSKGLNSYGPSWQGEIDEMVRELPRGCVLATCKLVDCERTDLFTSEGYGSGYRLTEQERAFGDYSPGRWAWVLEDVKPLAEPVPAKGMLGLWE